MHYLWVALRSQNWGIEKVHRIGPFPVLICRWKINTAKEEASSKKMHRKELIVQG
jgi:hypothetical protein